MAKKKQAKRKVASKRKRAPKKTTRTKRKSGLTQMSYSLSDDLREVCGSGKMTRPQIIKKIWAYIKSHRCQDTKNRRMIVPDQKLAPIIGNRPIDMLKLSGCLNKHIKK